MSDVASAHWRALGTSVDLLVHGGDPESARDAVTELLDEVDRAFSRFRPDSELSRLNGLGGRPLVASELFARAVESGIRAGRVSDGLVDPTVGRAMRLAGYDDDFSRLGSRSEPLTIHLEPVPGWQTIHYDARSRTVRLSPGVELDLGSTGKALAADLAAPAALDAGHASGALVSLGGDIATAGAAPAGGWRILVAEDSATPAVAPGEVVAITGGALATSGTTVRRWIRGGAEVHHIIDPRTGGPAQSPWRTASVVAASCVDANIAATAAIVRGPAAADWLTDCGLSARLVAVDGEIVRIGGWPGAPR